MTRVKTNRINSFGYDVHTQFYVKNRINCKFLTAINHNNSESNNKEKIRNYDTYKQ